MAAMLILTTRRVAAPGFQIDPDMTADECRELLLTPRISSAAAT